MFYRQGSKSCSSSSGSSRQARYAKGHSRGSCDHELIALPPYRFACHLSTLTTRRRCFARDFAWLPFRHNGRVFCPPPAVSLGAGALSATAVDVRTSTRATHPAIPEVQPGRAGRPTERGGAYAAVPQGRSLCGRRSDELRRKVRETSQSSRRFAVTIMAMLNVCLLLRLHSQRATWIRIAGEVPGTLVWVIVFDTPYEVSPVLLPVRRAALNIGYWRCALKGSGTVSAYRFRYPSFPELTSKYTLQARGIQQSRHPNSGSKCWSASSRCSARLCPTRATRGSCTSSPQTFRRHQS